MANQLQNSEYINGEWVSRPVDVYEIMARARQKETKALPEPESTQKPHKLRLGILSRTVFNSPYVKFILPANIRHKKLNDVVFIGEDSVHLKEVRGNGPLRHIASKHDIGGQILAARVFGETRKDEVKLEHGTPWKRKDVHAQRRSATGEEADALPSEIIVLTLSSKALMFLWARQALSGRVEFRHKTVRLPAGTSRFDRPGTLLAIDPRCRAMAVAASEGQFVLYATMDMNTWRNGLRSGCDDVPIVDERIFPIQGRAMFMEFLSPGLGKDDNHVILVFVVAHAGRLKVTCYDWDARYNLATVTARAERVAVDLEDHIPSLLVPLSRSPDFLLICDRHIMTCTQVLSGTIKQYRVNIDSEVMAPLRPGHGTHQPHWVQWKRVARNDEYPYEIFYIAREDGKVLYIEVSDHSRMPVLHDAGQFPHPVDQAFASLDVDAGPLNRLQPDVLVAAGTTSDGCLSKIGSWVCEGHNLPYLRNNEFALVETIPNWAPTSDLLVTRLPGLRYPFERDRDSIFVSNGRAPHGTISELRRGIRALVDVSWEGMKGSTGLSVLDYGCQAVAIDGRQVMQYHTVLLINMPPESLLLRISRANDDWHIEQISDENQQGQADVLSQVTMSACTLSDRLAVHITQSEARILSRPSLVQVSAYKFPTALLLAATSTDTRFIAVAFRAGTQSTLGVMVVSDDGFISSLASLPLSCDPTCLELIVIDGVTHVFVGLSNATVSILMIHSSELRLMCECDLRATDMRAVCDSAALLCQGTQRVIACGARNGMLIWLRLSISATGIDIASTECARMGNTSVKITRSTTNPSVALAACGADFCFLQCPQNESSTFDPMSIWFEDGEKQHYQQSPISAWDQLPFGIEEEHADEGLGGLIFAVSGDRLLLARLDHETGSPRSQTRIWSKAVPRKLNTNATPQRIAYSDKLRKLVVATIEPKEERGPPNGYRTMRAAIQLLQVAEPDIDIKQETETETRNPLLIAEFTLKNYERVCAILEWIVTDHKNRPHHFIYVATSITVDPGQETGRRLFLQIADDSKFVLKKEKNYGAPVRCMALYDDMHLVTIFGNTMVLEEYEKENMKWAKRAQVVLPSPAVHLSVSKPFLYVSTSGHSHLCYEYIAADLNDPRPPTFEQLLTDSRQRNTVHHCTIPLAIPAATMNAALEAHQGGAGDDFDRMDIDTPVATSSSQLAPMTTDATVILITDKTCQLSALLHLPDVPSQTFKSDASTLFEAALPRSVTRVQRGQIRPPWRRSPDDQVYAGILADDIIGSCSDGTVYAFSILDEKATRMLRLIQNLIQTRNSKEEMERRSVVERKDGSGKGKTSALHMFIHGPSSPSAPSSPASSTAKSNSKRTAVKLRDIDPDQGKRHPRNHHVDGDMILRFFDEDILGQTDRLAELLSDTKREVGELFLQLATDLGIVGNMTGTGSEWERAVLVAVGRWMSGVLQDLL